MAVGLHTILLAFPPFGVAATVAERNHGRLPLPEGERKFGAFLV
jgi:hypothetical protein